MNISISEINSFLQCRRAWDLTSANRQSKRHKITPRVYFVIGSGVHEAIDAQARGDDPLEAFEEYVNGERADRRSEYEEITGTTPWASEMEEFEDSVILARALIHQYFDMYGWENPLESQGLKYIATEVPFSIPLFKDTEHEVNFVGTFDGIATDIETESYFYLTENKTAARKPDLDQVQRGNQFVGYNWAFRVLTGQTPAGTLYNGLLKKLIKSPKVLKSGALSVDKAAPVTLQTFLDALKRGGQDPVKYLSYMEFLEERERNGDDRFFFRSMFTYSNEQLDNWFNSTLKPIAFELVEPHKEAIGLELPIYPNYTACQNCLVKDYCTAIDMGEDVEHLLDVKYETKTYGTMEAVSNSRRSPVTNMEELVALFKRG